MKRQSRIPALLAFAAGALLIACSARRVDAQRGFFGPILPVGPTLQTLGPRYPVSISGYPTPFFVVSPNGIRGGYLGPNGAYIAPGGQYSFPVGSTGSANLYSPLSPTGTFGAPSAVETYNPANPNQPVPAFSGAIPRTSDTISARIDKENRLVISWAGDPRTVAGIRVALLDKDHKVIKEEAVTKLPVQARLAITSKTSYYQVYIEYVNGTVTNVISPL